MLKFGAVVLVLCGLALHQANAVEVFVNCTSTGVTYSNFTFASGEAYEEAHFAGNPTNTSCKINITAGEDELYAPYGAEPCGVVITNPTTTGNVSCDAWVIPTAGYRTGGDVFLECPCVVINGTSVVAGTAETSTTLNVQPKITPGVVKPKLPAMGAKVMNGDMTADYKVGEKAIFGAQIVVAGVLSGPKANHGMAAAICKKAVVRDDAKPNGKMEEVIQQGCTVAKKNLVFKQKEIQLPGLTDGVSGVLMCPCKGLVAFKFTGASNKLRFTVTCAVCSTASHPDCQKQDTCPSTKRKRRDASGESFLVERNVTISIQTEDPRQKENAGCEGYVSSTIFYVTVIVLAVLLVVTIGVAAFFGTRAGRAAVILAGKENPVYG